MIFTRIIPRCFNFVLASLFFACCTASAGMQLNGQVRQEIKRVITDAETTKQWAELTIGKTRFLAAIVLVAKKDYRLALLEKQSVGGYRVNAQTMVFGRVDDGYLWSLSKDRGSRAIQLKQNSPRGRSNQDEIAWSFRYLGDTFRLVSFSNSTRGTLPCDVKAIYFESKSVANFLDGKVMKLTRIGHDANDSNEGFVGKSKFAKKILSFNNSKNWPLDNFDFDQYWVFYGNTDELCGFIDNKLEYRSCNPKH